MRSGIESVGSVKWRLNRCHRKISLMEDTKDKRKAIVLSVGVALLTLIPYIISNSIVEPDSMFSGFLLNPVDGFSYLAKMRQGSSGDWLFHLPYTAEPGEGALLFIYYILLGKVINITGWAPLFIYHLTRILASFLMFFVAYLFVTRFTSTRRTRWAAYVLILFGSGFGWLGIPFGVMGNDLNIPESIPFLSAYTNPHFPLTGALFLGILIVVIGAKEWTWKRFLSLFLLSTVLAAVQPFMIVVLVGVFVSWQIWELWIQTREDEFIFRDLFSHPIWRSIVAIVLGSAPWMIYDYMLTINHTALSLWNAQNLTASPPITGYLFGFGGVLILAFVAIFKTNIHRQTTGRLLISWMTLQLLLLYAPFGLQRRFSLGLYFPMAILAVIALERIVREKRFNIAFSILLALSIPSNLIVVASGLVSVAAHDEMLVIGDDEFSSYEWLGAEGERGSIVLANELHGNRIPAFASMRVLYGHPFETPNAIEQLALVERLLSSEVDPTDVMNEIIELDVRYVLVGPSEVENGFLSWLGVTEQVFSKGEYAVYEIKK